MAVLLTATLPSGLVATNAYWRLNSFDQVPNKQADGSYSVPCVARFRPFVSAASFGAGHASLDPSQGMDVLVEFTPSDIGANLAEEAYAALKALPEFAEATDA